MTTNYGDEDLRRELRWISYAKPKTLLGFDHLGPAYLPSMSLKPKGYSICFDRVGGWSPPSQLIREVRNNNCELSLQLSLSFFHTTSKTFFGSTWMGQEVHVGDSTDVIDFDYSDIVYLISRINDPTCIGVVEIVASLVDTKKYITIGQYGCGWTMINLFNSSSRETFHDISDGHEGVQNSSSTFLLGTPRDLLIYDPTEWKDLLREMKSCTLTYRGFGHRKLVKISRLLAENEPIGKYDPIAGILPKNVVTNEGKKPTSVSCLADEEISDGKKGIICLPSSPAIVIPMELKVIDFQILIPNRSQVEDEVIASVIRNNVDAERSQAKVLQRTAKICIHNGHTVIGGEWKSYRLVDDKDDRDILLLNEEAISIDGYVPDDKMAIAILIEYEIGLPSENHTFYNPQAMFNSAISTDKSTTTIVLGAALFVPSDGKVLFLRNQNGKSKGADSMGVELKMRNDDVCTWLSPKPLFDMSKLRKASKSLNSRRGKGAKDEDDEEEASIIAFDLQAFDPIKGELSHLDDVDVREGDARASTFRDYDAAEEKSNSKKFRMGEEKYSGAKDEIVKKSSSIKKPAYKVSTKARRERDNDEESIAESLVEGNSDVCSLRLDPNFYSGRGDADSDAFSVASFRSDNRISVPKDRNSLLYQSMNTKLHTAQPRKQQGGEIMQAREVLEPDSVLEQFKPDRREVMRAVSKTEVSAPAYSLRELSRGARSRLSRHGYSGVIQDSTGFLDNLQNRATVKQAAVDILLEAGDSLSINDITLQFAGYRAGAKGLNSTSVAYPRAIYFSYQFYTCQPTRTEPMRLLPADIGQVSVLARDEAHARDEIPLALRYIIDSGAASPTEAIEFAEYLANRTLYIDVWDADSLILLGTCGIPLRRIMRQGQPMAKCALECDVINSEAASNVEAGITTSTILDGGPISGSLVGSVDLIICNYGQEGRSESKRTDTNIKKVSDLIEGLNWRAITNQGERRSEVKNRPKNCVRAKPLAESAPELSQALRDHRQSSDGTKNVMRSLTATRGMEGVHTLTYDEVVVLFKRFQGSVKGTVQYSGALLRLLDLPSFNVAVRKLIQAFQIARGGHEVEKDMLRFADASGIMNISSLQEFFKFLFDRHGIAYRPEELGILASKLSNEKTAINVKDVINYCRIESERQDWAAVGKLIRRSVQKATLEGQDIGQMLAERDPQGEQYISSKEFKEFLQELSAFGKLSSNDIAITIRHFSESSESRKNTSTPVSLREVMAFLGGQYVGNANARIAKIILSGVDGKANRNVHDFMRSLRSQDKKGDGRLTYDIISSVFATYDVSQELSHDQIKAFLLKLDKKKVGSIQIDQLVEALGFHEAGVNDLASVLQMLIEKTHGKGASIAGIFRALDVDGNGLLSSTELINGLKQVQIIDSSNEEMFKSQLPEFMKKFDEDGEGNISLKEFLNFLGVKDYTPNIIQRMTKYFAVAISKGLSFDDIFKQLDPQKTGSLNVDDLSNSLKNMGVDIDEKDKAEFKVFDKDGDGSITLSEFMDFFKARVKKVQSHRQSKRLELIAYKFLEIMKTVLVKVSVEQLFKHFDKDGGGAVSSEEFKIVLKKLPQFKNLSDDDLDGLTQILDDDNSGEVSLNEFKSFIDKGTTASNKSEKINTKPTNAHEASLKFLHEILLTAKEKGLSIERIFGSIDKDKSGSVTLHELKVTLQKMKQFDDINDKEMESMLSALDADHSGSITLDEFIYFIDHGVPRKKSPRVKYSDDEKNTKNISPKQIFIAQITRIAEPDGGIKGFLAFLDDDEDGLIEKSALTRQFKREGVYEKISENDADKIIDSVSSGGKINLINLMKLLEGNDASIESSKIDDDFEGIPLVEYDFSSDPETRALEKKMRNLGRTLAKKGMDVEGLFKTHDLRDTGMIRRSEFIECMSTMGLYILEQGKVLDDAVNADDDVRKLQIQQINKIKGVTSGSLSYAQNASRSARKLILNDNSQGDFNEHMESMALVNWYRQSQKKMLLQRVLSHSLASNINLYPRFGKTLFFEYPLTNPFGHEERFVIDVSDPELRLVTSFEEWMHLRRSCRPCIGDLGEDPVEADMFDRDGYGNVQVALLPHETLYIPFTLMTLIPYTSQDALAAQKKFKLKVDRSESKSSNEFKVGESKSSALTRGESKTSGSGFEESKEEPARMIEVKMISGTHGHVVSVLRVSICPRPYVVDRTIRFFEPENCVMRRRIRLVGGFRESAFPGEFSLSSKYVHCVEGNYADQNQSSNGTSKVVVEFGPSNNNGELDLFIRYKCGTFPSVGDFHLLLYDDPFQSHLHEVWHVIVQSRQRLDVNSSVGGNATVDLVVRGDKFARRAKAFVSPTVDMVKFRPESTFQVVPGAYNRVEMNYFASQIGSRRMQVNLVDVDTRELLNAWILTTTVTAPTAMRTYDVEVSRGRGTNKKIIFKNPWDVTRRFQLVSSNEKVMKPRSPYLDVAPQGSAYLRLWFSGSDINRSGDVYLFLNDEQGNNEESFLFHIKETN